jgi:hypothetical protein
MLKKTLLSTILLLSTIANAQIQIDFSLTIDTEPSMVNVSCTLVTENNTLSTFINDDVIVDVLPQEDGDDVIVHANIYRKVSADVVELVAQPVIKTVWNQPAVVTLANTEDEDSNKALTFAVIASRVE